LSLSYKPTLKGHGIKDHGNLIPKSMKRQGTTLVVPQEQHKMGWALAPEECFAQV
jgi:hypothetical protein